MWTETKGGLYKRFVFKNYRSAWAFMMRVSSVINILDHHPRWQNEGGTVEFWLSTHSAEGQITALDRELAGAIDEAAINPKEEPVEIIDVKDTTKITEAKVYADGGSRGNPGPSATGFVLLDMSDNVLVSDGEFLGVTTNNQAEYQALKNGLETAKKLGVKRVQVYMDSLLVINQMKGVFKVRNRDLWPVHESIKQLAGEFEHVSYTHVPRELNKLADAEVNKTLDENTAV